MNGASQAGKGRRSAFGATLLIVAALSATAGGTLVHRWMSVDIVETPAPVAAQPQQEAAPAPPSPEVPAEKPRGRRACGPSVSPDGKWLLQERSETLHGLGTEDDRYSVREHRLVAVSLDERDDREMLLVKEYRSDAQWERPYKKDLLEWHSWTPCGWSDDGKKAYYVAKWAWSELGGYYPDGTYGGEKLVEVDVATGKETLMFDLGTRNVMNGIRDVHVRKGLMTFDDKDGLLQLAMLDSDGGVTLVDKKPSGPGLSEAVISPNGRRVAVVTFDSPDPEYVYTLEIIDLSANGHLEGRKTVRLGSDWRFVGWIDEHTVLLRVEKDGKTTYEKIVV